MSIRGDDVLTGHLTKVCRIPCNHENYVAKRIPRFKVPSPTENYGPWL